ncbi:8-oxo-dGTP diphosphatase [Kineococcus radiotolerans]|uniref:8-oxo-dGTP diphosphatase n=1 Tax=Kineococcus radiotolerans TaxID=131568 RepID=A0A7W4TRE9_KINRA|nr:NUDIX domain-containing protein [Kineococcus radiotolerans]MBB2903327.1 8-oxo-dGTP diphosphatase [Kineococcus radiotolerans]
MIEVREKAEGVQVIVLNPRGEVLLQLRDDDPDIPYPGRRCLPGGHLEDSEDPATAAVRELREEMSLHLPLAALHHVVTAHRSYGLEHTFWTPLDLDARRVPLTEGQAVRFHTIGEIRSMKLGYEDNLVLEDFFAARGHG